MKTKINKKNVGTRIKQIRLNKGYTLESFGKLFGASKGNVQQWENGVSLPNKERLATISKIADMTVNELLYGSVDEFVKENYRYYNYVDSIEEAEQLYNESIEDRDEWLELRALDTPERIETFIVKGEEFEGYARYDETYTVEIVGIADRQGGEEQLYLIDISHR